MKFKKAELVKDLVTVVLTDNTNGYMTVGDIAEIAFGQAYNAYTYKGLDEKVRRSIDGARNIIAANGDVLLGLKNQKLKGNAVDRWKIATVEDQDDFMVVVKERTNRVKGYVKARDTMLENASEKNLLPDVELKQLQ